MQCRSCGATVPDESSFCNRCGASLRTPEKAGAFPPSESSPSSETEKDVWSGRYSIKAMGGWMLLLSFLGLVFLYTFVSRYLQERETSRGTWILGGVFLITFCSLELWLLVVGLKRRLSTSYRLTTQRLFAARGIVNRTVDEIELVRVDDVSVHQNIIHRVFNVGNVTVLTPTDATCPTTVLDGIDNPVEVKEKIRALTQNVRKKSIRLETI